MQHLFGAILKPSHTNRFTDWWTSSLRDTLVSRSLPQASEQEKKTQDTFGLGLQTEFDFFGQDSASLKMSKDISPSDSEKSSENWKALVIKRRGEYSLRVKSARLTKESGSSSWPTAAARDYKGESGAGRQERKGNPADTLPNAVALWPTPSCGECLDQGTNWETLAKLDKGGRILRRIATMEMSGQAAPASSSSLGSRPESWATPTARDNKSGRGNEERDYKELTPMVERTQSGKLNPRWVETLMGLPIGWTMPSCIQPVTIAPTNCDCSETELFQQQQRELF